MASKKQLGDLPETMMTEVVLRLPVKSLLICKSVCKPWLSTISNPHFLKSHIQHSITISRNVPTLLNIIDFQKLPSLAIDPHGITAFFNPDDLEQHQRHRHRHRRQLVNQALDDANRQDLLESPL
ncbi:hypothetical protein POM88_008758 [Heracleum sosnowskyi]|uniref:F-box domain-containing protein n=1 Tax=Heracleum sosnowskyi TaxID=360622 RepID=A0AAD8N200_9APIA|nr:hypothetical protein POM88_008758 [Heracleum sosnowskyi]